LRFCLQIECWVPDPDRPYRRITCETLYLPRGLSFCPKYPTLFYPYNLRHEFWRRSPKSLCTPKFHTHRWSPAYFRVWNAESTSWCKRQSHVPWTAAAGSPPQLSLQKGRDLSAVPPNSTADSLYTISFIKINYPSNSRSK
jgi:hypothetical protein